MLIEVTEFAKKLMSKRSVSGEKDEGAIELLSTKLASLGFKIDIKEFSGDKSYNVLNLYAEVGKGKKNLCFAGHTDVVPAGDLDAWTVPPFNPEVIGGFLIGRGAVDMKASIAAWVAAISEVFERSPSFKERAKLSMLITGDEEADAINGTEKLLQYITDKGVKINSCIVGEPTNQDTVGDMIKIGRRGSINFTLTVNGKQGHVAYPDAAKNPNKILVKILDKLLKQQLDEGNEYFQPSNLEITSIDVGNNTTNLIPAHSVAKFNIRFNNAHTIKSIIDLVRKICTDTHDDFFLDHTRGSESFLSKPAKLCDLTVAAIEDVCGKKPEISTSGGTSDARFIKDYAEVVECGLINKTAHQIDEKIEVAELEKLKDVYKNIIIKYFE